MSGLVKDCDDLGYFVRMTRKDNGMTQTQLADKASVGLRFVSEMERGKETAQLACVLRVLDALGVQLQITSKRHSSNNLRR